ncbi:MAG: hypothetical protein CVV44_18280 [Spirochaetae bacterium HGW-Spirochaetae-1]|jgi:hypothetical protein|nr:MAG: hypothetical protein CVV44_18280 [Spirochaetae bacterium HGW-Spirochaetae-1]
MQNIDFYTGQNSRQFSHQFDSSDPEYFTRISGSQNHDQEHIKKKTSRMIFLISALCIISFTTGLAIGIKFAGGEERKIVDDTTFRAVTDLRSKVSGMMTPQNANAETKNNFPVQDFPFVISIGRSTYSPDQSQEIAAYLSSQGHRVILSKKQKGYRIYTGPYQNKPEAESGLKKLDTCTKFSIGTNCRIIKRQ